MIAIENVIYNFVDICPESELMVFIKDSITRLQLNAPSDSAIKLTLKKVGQVFSYKCRICSFSGIFRATAVNSCPIEGMRQIEQRLNEQLMEWKKRRFQDSRDDRDLEHPDSLKVIPIQDQYDLICG